MFKRLYHIFGYQKDLILQCKQPLTHAKRAMYLFRHSYEFYNHVSMMRDYLNNRVVGKLP